MGSVLTGFYTLGIPLNGEGIHSRGVCVCVGGGGGGGRGTQVLNGYAMPNSHEEREQ